MDGSMRFRVDSDVSFQKLEDATVLVHLTTGRIHHTNATGTRIWELLADGRSVAETLEALQAEFDAPREQLEREVAEFVRQLSEEKMLAPAGGQA